MIEYNERPLHGGVQRLYRFDNEYGASVIRHGGSYGSDKGLWELAIIKWRDDEDYDLVYDTGLANDVVGHLTEEDVEEILLDIKSL